MGRTSIPVAGAMMAGPVMRKLGLQKFDDLMYGAMHSPTIAQNLEGLIAARTAAKSEWFGKRLMDSWENNKGAILAGVKGGVKVAIGAAEIPNNFKRSIPATLNQATVD